MDGKIVYHSGSMKKGETVKVIDIDISAGKELKLVVDVGDDGKADGGHAVWGNACFIK